MCEWDSKGQCLSAYKIVNENSVVTLYLYETKLTRIIKFCSVWSIYAVQFWNWCMLLWAMWPVCLMFFNLSLWVCIIHYDIGVGGVGWGLDECLVHARLLLISGCCCSYMFFFRSNSPPPLLHEKKERIVKIVNFEVIEYDEQLSFFLSLVFQSFPNHTSIV